MKLSLFVCSAAAAALLFNYACQPAAADAGTPQSWKDGTCDGGYITHMSASTYNGFIAALTAECSSGDTRTVDTGVANQQTSVNHIDASQGFNEIEEYRKTKAQNGDLVGLVAPGFGQVGETTSASPQSFQCESRKKLCGFKVKIADVFQQMEWKCCFCPPGQRCVLDEDSSTGSGSPIPATGGLNEGSTALPIPVSESSTASTGITGDPQFIGFLGQSFQVHGMDSTVYNIISTSKLQFNAFFTYLDKGECREGTLCFSHPGNYFGKVGVSVKSADGKVTELLVSAGPVKEGMSVAVDGQEVLPSQKHLEIDSESKIYFPNAFDLYVETSEFSLKFENSDMFLNQQVSINSPLAQQIAAFKSAKAASAELMPHGILGQTWQRVEYNNRWKFIEGQLYDYIVADGLKGKTFKYNRF